METAATVDRISGRMSRSLGPYRILEPLGRGGMGVVYHARHTSTRQSVALKTVRVPHAEMLGSIRREIHALGRLSHPGIVDFLDEGVEEGTPWYAMELLEGTSLRGVIQQQRWPDPSDPRRPTPEAATDHWTAALSQAATSVSPQGASTARPGMLQSAPSGSGGTTTGVAEVLSFARRLCAPLAYMHGEGLVHRDLKPDNIVVRPDGMPVLVDFGLMSRHGGPVSRDALDVPGAAGTWAYMPPEQARGDVVDARADLYSLGCILYELLSGFPPFGFGGRDLVFKHATEEPPPLPDVPDELSELLGRLLAKQPNERLGHADDLAAALADLGAENGMGGPSPRPYLYRPVLAGRAEAVKQIDDTLEALKGGRGSLTLIGGESGVGKTRLAMEAARFARRDGIRVLVGECDEHRRGPLSAFGRPLQEVADGCRESGRDETERLFGRRAKVLSIACPELRCLPGQDAQPEPVDLPPRAAELRLFSYLAQTLQEVARHEPLVVILDDLQWADELTTSFLDHLLATGTLPSAGILLLGTYRTEEQTDALARLAELDTVQNTILGRLPEAAVGRMVQEMLALPEPPAGLTRFLQERSEGVPFFVAEYLRVAIAEGLLFRDARGNWLAGDDAALEGDYRALPLPHSLEALVLRRLDGLAASTGELVELAAVVGREASPRLLEAASRRGELELLADLDELRRRQILEFEGDRITFSHDRIREVAYRHIPAGDRARRHEAVATAITTVQAEDVDEAELGRHWELAGRRERARPCYLAAARTAESQFSNREAARLYRAFLDLAEQPTSESIAARGDLGGVLEVVGDMEEANRQFAIGVEEAVATGDRRAEASMRRSLGESDRELGRMEDCLANLEVALRLSREVKDRRGEALVLGNFVNTYARQGRLAEAQRMAELSLAAHRECGERKGEGDMIGRLAALHAQQGRMGEAEAMFQEALTISREVENRPSEGVVLSNLALLQTELGRLEVARATYAQALATAREVGDRRLEGRVLSNLGLLQGDTDAAEATFGEAITILGEVGLRGSEAHAMRNLAGVHERRGRLERAGELYRRVLQILQEIGERSSQGLTLIGLAQVELVTTGDTERAMKLSAQGERCLDTMGENLDLAGLLVQRGHIMLATETAADDLLERASRIAHRLETGKESDLSRAIDILSRANQAFYSGHPLICGYCPEDIGPGQLDWLRQHRPDALPPALR